MRQFFSDRQEAGQQLANRLGEYAQRDAGLVLGLARGGVPVAFEIARALELPLECMVVRKLRLPGHPELAMGALASGGIVVPNTDVIEACGIKLATLISSVAKEQRELERREQLYHGGRPLGNLRDRRLILVDDGIATGTSMRAAVCGPTTRPTCAICRNIHARGGVCDKTTAACLAHCCRTPRLSACLYQPPARG